MEQNTRTLGKRIAALRKAKGLTQEQLAEKVGLSAQAVSKWENDLTCPDITALPLLAEIFGVSVDELLGVKPVEPHVVILEKEKEETAGEDGKSVRIEFPNSKTHFRGLIGLCITGILIGVTLLIREMKPALFAFGAWTYVWPLLLLLPGLNYLIDERKSRIRVLPLCLMVYGLYQFVYTLLGMPAKRPRISWYMALLILAVVLLVKLLLSRLRPGSDTAASAEFSAKNGKGRTASEYSEEHDALRLEAAFCSNTFVYSRPVLRSADIECSFGDITVDLTGAAIEENALIKAEVSFGNLTLLLPGDVSAVMKKDVSFGSCAVTGGEGKNGLRPVYIDAEVAFGEMKLLYR